MLINKLRATVKTVLANTFAYEFAKSLYTKFKLTRDRQLFQKHHPESEYINYSKRQIAVHRESGFYSQYSQDFFLWSNYLSNIDSGKFIDIGANKPVTNSNSFFFEKNDWTGVAIDPLKHFQPEWIKERKTPLICGAVSDSICDEPFIEILPSAGWEHALSGFKAHVRTEDLALYEHKEYLVATKPLSLYIAEPSKVDLILIDVEGAEMAVLRGIDFTVFSPNYLLIENDRTMGGSETLRNYLKDQGYKCVARIAATDDFYVKKTCL